MGQIKEGSKRRRKKRKGAKRTGRRDEETREQIINKTGKTLQVRTECKIDGKKRARKKHEGQDKI